MNAAFLDTVGLIALWDEGDEWQEPASLAMARLNTSRSRLLTTPQVLLECGNAASRTPFRVDVCLLRDRLIQQNDMIEPTSEDLEEAWRAYRQDNAGGASIVDHISFNIMRRLGITDAFTNDRHFKTAGFKTLF